MTPQELKSSILQLAIQGKLVEQRPEEGTAEELYQQIQTEKQKLIKEGKIKEEKALSEIAEDEIPFDIPENWRWVRLIDLCKSICDGDHQPPPQVLNGIPFLVISNISSGALDFTNTRCVPQEYFDALSKDRIAEKGDILFTVTGSYGIPVTVESNRQFCFQRHIALLKLLADRDYLYYVLKSPVIQSQCDATATGTAQKTVGLKSLRNMILPLPPLAEQKRIVAKIEELLPYIDRYEQAWSKLEAFNKRFPVDMQKSILQMAIQGKLVEQRPEEGTGEELYQQIQAEKQKLIKAGKIKKEKPLPEIAEDEVPFDIPESWKWVKLGAVISISSGNGLTANHMDKSGTIPVYGGNGVTGYHSTFNVDKPTLVIGRVGFYCGSTHITEEKAWITDNAFITTFDESHIEMKWLKYFIDFLEPRKKASSTAQPVISGKLIYPMLMPLPPLAEQKRIVARLEELLPLCERLK